MSWTQDATGLFMMLVAIRFNGEAVREGLLTIPVPEAAVSKYSSSHEEFGKRLPFLFLIIDTHYAYPLSNLTQ